MSDDILARLRLWSDNAKEQDATDIVVGLCEAAAEIELLRMERKSYRTRYLKCLASKVWEPNTHWKTYQNPQRDDRLFVATVGELVRSCQAIPHGALSIPYGLRHNEATEVVEILNAWTEQEKP